MPSAARGDSKGRQLGSGPNITVVAFRRGQLVPTKVVGLNTVLERMLEMVQRLVGEGVQITTTLGGQLWPVKLDARALEQVIVNLAGQCP